MINLGWLFFGIQWPPFSVNRVAESGHRFPWNMRNAGPALFTHWKGGLLQTCNSGTGVVLTASQTTSLSKQAKTEMHQTTKQSNNQPYLLSWCILVVENIWKFTCLYLVELPDRGPRWKMHEILVTHRWWHAKLYVLIFTLGIWGYTKYLPKQLCWYSPKTSCHQLAL